MRTFGIADMTGGWFVGNFEPSALRATAAEVCLKRHQEGENWPAHYHAVAVEVTLVVSGRMAINCIEMGPGDGFVLDPGEVAVPVFHTDCTVVVVKVPSVPGDKYPASLT
jgi:quercetin dioxygenase-like cupin family protein